MKEEEEEEDEEDYIRALRGLFDSIQGHNIQKPKVRSRENLTRLTEPV